MKIQYDVSNLFDVTPQIILQNSQVLYGIAQNICLDVIRDVTDTRSNTYRLIESKQVVSVIFYHKFLYLVVQFLPMTDYQQNLYYGFQ